MASVEEIQAKWNGATLAMVMADPGVTVSRTTIRPLPAAPGKRALNPTLDAAGVAAGVTDTVAMAAVALTTRET